MCKIFYCKQLYCFIARPHKCPCGYLVLASTINNRWAPVDLFTKGDLGNLWSLSDLRKSFWAGAYLATFVLQEIFQSRYFLLKFRIPLQAHYLILLLLWFRFNVEANPNKKRHVAGNCKQVLSFYGDWNWLFLHLHTFLPGRKIEGGWSAILNFDHANPNFDNPNPNPNPNFYHLILWGIGTFSYHST